MRRYWLCVRTRPERVVEEWEVSELWVGTMMAAVCEADGRAAAAKL